MKGNKPIPADAYNAIRLIGEQRKSIIATIDRAQTMLLSLPTAKQLAYDHNLPLNTVRQLLLDKGYGGRRVPKAVRAASLVEK